MKDNNLFAAIQEKKFKLLESEIKDVVNFEEKIKNMYISEFEEKLCSILSVKETDFMSNFNSRMMLIIEDIYSQEALNNRQLLVFMKKYEKHIFEKFYTTNFQILTKAIKEYEKYNSNGIYLTHFHKHCRFTEEYALHSCHGKLIQISSNYVPGVGLSKNSTEEKKYHNNITHVICIGCKKSYLSNSINLYCNSCNTEYYSSVLLVNENKELMPATWDKYHCGAIINDTMKCIKCKNLFYLRIKDNVLYCQNCKFQTDPMGILWTCFICNKDFTTGAKIYNSMEFKLVKTAIREALLYKKMAYPNKLQCCDYQVDKMVFFHKKECSGVLYKGEMNNESIVVCEKCKMMNFEKKFIWTCPKCNKRFKDDNEVLLTETDCKNHGHKKKNSIDISNNNSNAYNQLYEEENNNIKSKIRHSISSNMVIMVNNNMVPTQNKRNSNPLAVARSIQPDEKYLRKEIIIDKNLTNLNETTKPSLLKKSIIQLNNLPFKDQNNSRVKSNEKRDLNILNHAYNKKLSDNSILDLDKSRVQNNGLKGNNNINICIKNTNIISNVSPLHDEKKITKIEVKGESSPHRVGGKIGNLIDFISPNKFLNKQQDKVLIEDDNFHLDNKSKIFNSFNIDDFQVYDQIGEGTYGHIYLALDKKNKKYAMKKLIVNNEKDVDSYLDEFNLVFSCKHTNILTLYGYYQKKLDETTYVLYVLMELASNDWDQEIKNRISEKKFYSEKELINILKQIVSALAFLQNNKVAHRDIKPQNVLVFPNGIYKIADFGEAKEVKVSKEMNTLRGTELYMSPVLFNGLKNNKSDISHNPYKSDVFSLAFCLIYASALTYNPIYDLRRVNDMKTIIMVINRYFSGKFSLNFITLLHKMLDINESKRMDFVELEQFLKESF